MEEAKSKPKHPKVFDNYDKFSERVGILSEKELKKLGWNCDNGNRICFSQLNELIDFVDKLNNPPPGELFVMNSKRIIEGKKQIKLKKYHIATDFDASSLEDEYCVQHGIDPDTNELKVVATCISNTISYVNRMDYYLCDGDPDPELILEEIEEI